MKFMKSQTSNLKFPSILTQPIFLTEVILVCNNKCHTPLIVNALIFACVYQQIKHSYSHLAEKKPFRKPLPAFEKIFRFQQKFSTLQRFSHVQFFPLDFGELNSGSAMNSNDVAIDVKSITRTYATKRRKSFTSQQQNCVENQRENRLQEELQTKPSRMDKMGMKRFVGVLGYLGQSRVCFS